MIGEFRFLQGRVELLEQKQVELEGELVELTSQLARERAANVAQFHSILLELHRLSKGEV